MNFDRVKKDLTLESSTYNDITALKEGKICIIFCYLQIPVLMTHWH